MTPFCNEQHAILVVHWKRAYMANRLAPEHVKKHTPTNKHD